MLFFLFTKRAADRPGFVRDSLFFAGNFCFLVFPPSVASYIVSGSLVEAEAASGLFSKKKSFLSVNLSTELGREGGGEENRSHLIEGYRNPHAKKKPFLKIILSLFPLK